MEPSARPRTGTGSDCRCPLAFDRIGSRRNDLETGTRLEEEPPDPPPGLDAETGEALSQDAAQSSLKEQAEGSCLPAITRADGTPADSEAVSEPFPTEERLRQMERPKKRKEAGLDQFATRRHKVVEQHFGDCGDDLSSIVD